MSLTSNQKDNLQLFARILMKLRDEEEVTEFLSVYFETSELEKIIQRYNILTNIHAGLIYKEIERKTGASSATISKINNSYKYEPIVKKVLDRLKKK